MTTSRRRLVRLMPIVDPNEQRFNDETNNFEGDSRKERAALDRWMSRLKRAFNAMMKAQQRIARIEKQLTTREGN